MEIDIDKVKELRNLTGCSMLLCKQALEYSNEDQELAIAYIRAKSYAVATKGLTFDERVKRFLK